MPGIGRATLRISSSHSELKSFDIQLRANKVGKAATSSVLASGGPLLWMRASSFDVSPLAMGSYRAPTGQDPVRSVELSNGERYLALSITRLPGSTDSYPSVEVSPNLLEWYSGERHTTILQEDHSLLRIRDNTPLAPGSKRYIRVKKD